MAILTNWSFWMPIVLTIALLYGIFGNFRARAALVCALLAIGVVDSIVVGHLKHLVGRPRPYMVVNGVREVELARVHPRILALGKPLQIEYSNSANPLARGPSFPSAHAANNFAVATVFILFFRRWGWLLLIPAILISYSRIYVGSHWPLDVAAGALIGIGVTVVLIYLIEKVWRRWGPRWFPHLAKTHPSLLKD